MKLVQVNIWGGKLGQQIIDLLKTERPDFVCMQEVNDLKGRSGYKFFATLDEIKEGAGLDHAFMSPTWTARYMRRKISYGNAILSRFPFASTETVFTYREYIPDYDVERDYGNVRNLQITSVKTGDRTLNLLNHHGYWIYGSKTGDHETLRQMKLVAGQVRKLSGPLILSGDFNLAPDSKSLGLINKELRNLSVEHDLKRTYTQLSAVESVSDYIFVNDSIKVKNFRKSDGLVSDHNALVMEFDI